MDLRKLKTLLVLMRKYDLVEMELEEEGQKVRLRKGGVPVLEEASAPRAVRAAPAAEAAPASAPAAPAAPKAPEKTGLLEVKAPIVGTFYRSPKPGDPPFSEIGVRIKKGATICIVEAMKVMNEIKSDYEGVVEEILVENGAPVEYGQVLIRLRP